MIGDGDGPCRTVISVLDALVAFHADEERQNVFKTPAAIAEIEPVIVVAAIASDVNHVFDSTRTTENLAARLKNTPTVQVPLRNCPITPIVVRVLKLRVGAGDARQRKRVSSSCLDKQHSAGWVLR